MNRKATRRGRHSSSKKRVRIPVSIRDDILVACLHRCCICHDHGVQTNHIDGDPSNWDPDNLIPLCPSCHARVHSKSLLTSGYTARQLRKYRDEWIETCKKLRIVATPQVTLERGGIQLRMTIQSLEKRISALERKDR